jgi:hypothetical protein
MKVNPVEMTLEFMDKNKTYDFNSRSNLYNMVKEKCQLPEEEIQITI